MLESGDAFVNDQVDGFRPAVTRAPNGDFVAVFNTTGDVNAGGELWTMRSTDEGRTWSTAAPLKKPSYFPGGSIWSGRGLTTLRDGTLLLPFNEGVLEQGKTRMQSVMYMARSTDNGYTWTGLDTPIKFPATTREMWACCHRPIELSDGSLITTAYGTKELVPDWQKDPQRWRAVSIKSYDGGRTWTDYREISWDQYTPAYANAVSPTGTNEPVIEKLRDGRLVAILRHVTVVPWARDESTRKVYLSYSNDNGNSWSEPVASSVIGETPSVTTAPCSAGLPARTTKLLFGYRDVSDRTSPIYSSAAIGTSFDGGVTWPGKTYVELPNGIPLANAVSAEIEFQWLDAERALIMFQYKIDGTSRYRIAWNIIKDSSAADCAAQAKESREASKDIRSLFVMREDYSQFPYNYARQQIAFPKSAKVADIARDVAPRVSCYSNNVTLFLRRDGRDRLLDPSLSLEELGVRSGDVVVVHNADRPVGTVVGLADWDDFPEVRDIYGWNDKCSFPIALDFQTRSLGIETGLRPGQSVKSVSLRGTGPTSVLQAANFTVWSSADNQDWAPVTGWTLERKIDSENRLTLKFTGIDVDSRYLKIHQNIAENRVTRPPTFVISDPARDVTLEKSTP